MPPRGKRRIAGAAVAVGLVATVFFGFAPRIVEAKLNHALSPGPYAASERAKRLHAELTVVDLHADSLLWGRDLLERGTRGNVDVPRLVEGNVALQGFDLVTKTPRGQNIERNGNDSDNITPLAIAQLWPPRAWASLTERALYQAGRLQEMAADSKGQLTLIRTAADLDAYLVRRKTEHGITAGLLGVEGAQALDGDLANIDRLFDAGVRVMAPTHFSDNDIGGSRHGTEKGGLTEKGREMIKRMEAKKMIVDVAHASDRTVSDVLAIATRPVIVSHTGVRGTCDNQRNLSDAQLRAIAATGGVVGIGFWPTAVCSTDASAIARAIKHAAGVAGVEHVALGSDFDGATVTGFDASGFVLVTDALLAEGFSEHEVRLIMGENTLRVLRAALPP